MPELRSFIRRNVRGYLTVVADGYVSSTQKRRNKYGYIELHYSGTNDFNKIGNVKNTGNENVAGSMIIELTGEAHGMERCASLL